MYEIIAYCGLICQGCPIYWATKEKNEEKKEKMRVEIARQCKEYDLKYELQDITDCDGCKTEGGRLFSGCKKCEIRKCARGKKIENCAHCDQYACEKLKKLSDADAKSRLDLIRSTL